MFGRDYAKAKASFSTKMKSYEAKVEEREQAARKADKLATFKRSATLSGFGVFNFDRFYHMKNVVKFSPAFFLPALKKVFKNVFLLIKDKDIVMPWHQGNYSYEFALSPDEEVHIVTMDDDGKLYEFTSKEFKKIDFNNVELSGEYTFNMEPTNVTVASRDDLNDYLDNL